MNIVIFALLFISSVVQCLPPPTSPDDLHIRSNALENILSPRVLQVQKIWDSPATQTIVLAQDRPDGTHRTFPDDVEAFAGKYHNVNWETMVVFISMSGIYTMGIPLSYMDGIYGQGGEVDASRGPARAMSWEELIQEIRLTEGFGAIELFLFGINGCTEGAFQNFQNQEFMAHPITNAFIWVRESRRERNGETHLWTPVADALQEMIAERSKELNGQSSIPVNIKYFRTNPARLTLLSQAMVYQRVGTLTRGNQICITTNLWLGSSSVFSSQIIV